MLTAASRLGRRVGSKVAGLSLGLALVLGCRSKGGDYAGEASRMEPFVDRLSGVQLAYAAVTDSMQGKGAPYFALLNFTKACQDIRSSDGVFSNIGKASSNYATLGDEAKQKVEAVHDAATTMDLDLGSSDCSGAPEAVAQKGCAKTWATDYGRFVSAWNDFAKAGKAAGVSVKEL